MALTYTKGTPLPELDPVELGIQLDEAVAQAAVWLAAIPEDRANVAPAEGKWCAKEVMGHLVDSAVNNLQRIVRLEIVLDIEPEVRTQTYEQEEWVRAQRYAEKDWLEVLELWRVLNRHIAWTMRHVARHHLGRLCLYPDGTYMTFGFMMEDYVAHMAHHLDALKPWLEQDIDSHADGV
jgi:hypothetical protein